MSTPPFTITDEMVSAARAAVLDAYNSNRGYVNTDPLVDLMARVAAEAVAPLIAVQVLRPLERTDIELAINCLEAAATDQVEPERYRERYSDALGRFRQWQTVTAAITNDGRGPLTEDTP